MNSYILSLLVFILCLVALHLILSEVSKNNPGDIRIVWYFFSLSAVITFLLFGWARAYGAIDAQGGFHGKYGEILSFLLQASLGIEGSILLGLGILILIVAPQILSYILGGLYGCATSPIFVSETSAFVSWGFIKTFVVAAGVVIPLGICGQIDSANNWTLERTIGWVLLGLMLIVIAYGWLYCHRNASLISSSLIKISPGICRKKILSIHRWMTRRQSNNIPRMLY